MSPTMCMYVDMDTSLEHQSNNGIQPEMPLGAPLTIVNSTLLLSICYCGNEILFKTILLNRYSIRYNPPSAMSSNMIVGFTRMF